MRARATYAEHSTVQREEEGEGEKEGDTANLLVKDSHSQMVWATMVPAKGAKGFATNFVIAAVRISEDHPEE